MNIEGGPASLGVHLLFNKQKVMQKIKKKEKETRVEKTS